ncbi:MAG: hypothetical protein M1826_001284 [Phylliscum demangeonii]|nr:MAG: hypothetical protein M1826_001284 [Phylliscum demangeonii]
MRSLPFLLGTWWAMVLAAHGSGLEPILLDPRTYLNRQRANWCGACLDRSMHGAATEEDLGTDWSQALTRIFPPQAPRLLPHESLLLCELHMGPLLSADVDRVIGRLVASAAVSIELRLAAIEHVRRVELETAGWRCYDRDRKRPHRGPIYDRPLPNRWSNSVLLRDRATARANARVKKLYRTAESAPRGGDGDGEGEMGFGSRLRAQVRPLDPPRLARPTAPAWRHHGSAPAVVRPTDPASNARRLWRQAVQAAASTAHALRRQAASLTKLWFPAGAGAGAGAGPAVGSWAPPERSPGRRVDPIGLPFNE